MERYCTVMLAAIAAAFVPEPVLGCTCVVGVSVGEEVPTRVQRFQARGALFEGTALGIRTRTERSAGDSIVAAVREVTFVVRRSWRGVRQDTITVSSGVVANCGSFYQPGMSYLVVGDLSGHQVETGTCDFALSVRNESIEAAIDSLGAPLWTAPAVGERPIDIGIVRLGEAQPRGPPSRLVSLALFAPEGFDMKTIQVEVADTTVNLEWHGRVTLPLAEGLYRVRVGHPSGAAYEADLLVRCDESSLAPEFCTVVRIFQPPKSWWGDA